jgi:hypothetical protein
VLKIDTSAMSNHEKGLAQGIANRHIHSGQGYNLVGAQKLFKGTCAEGKTYAQCDADGKGGVDGSGWMWRPDSYKESSDTQELRRRWVECTAEAVAQSITDIKWIRMCVAPKPLNW